MIGTQWRISLFGTRQKSNMNNEARLLAEDLFLYSFSDIAVVFAALHCLNGRHSSVGEVTGWGCRPGASSDGIIISSVGW
jgi:hypothetical protein